MAAAAYRDQDLMNLRKFHDRDDIGHAGTTRNEAGRRSIMPFTWSERPAAVIERPAVSPS